MAKKKDKPAEQPRSIEISNCNFSGGMDKHDAEVMIELAQAVRANANALHTLASSITFTAINIRGDS